MLLFLTPNQSSHFLGSKNHSKYKFSILFILMLPLNNNYYSYQGLPQRNNYTFDLKVNVDFNNRRINLGVPPQPPAFSKTPEIPVIYANQPMLATQNPSLARPNMSYPMSQPVIHQVPPVWQPMPNYVYTQPSYNTVSHPYQYDQSGMRYSSKQNPRSTNNSYSNSSFSMGIERSVDAVECVICDKKINRDDFHDHLEQHKAKRREYVRNQYEAATGSQKINAFPAKNQNSVDYNPSRASQNSRIIEMGVSKLQQSNSHSLSRPIQDTHSRIVYAPRDFIENNSGTYSQPAYINSFSQNPQVIANKSRQNAIMARPTNEVQKTFYIQNQQRGFEANHNSKLSKVSSMKSINNQVIRKENSRSLSQQRDNYYFQQSFRNSSAAKSSKFQNTLNQTKNNYMNFDKSQSRTQQKKKQPSFFQIQQSVIHRINDYSRDYSILQLKKQLNIQQIEQQSSSDDQVGYLSVHASPPTRIYQSVSRSKNSLGMASSTNRTDKLTRTKMPVNYLARQEFIVNSWLTKSCYKSRHMNWK